MKTTSTQRSGIGRFIMILYVAVVLFVVPSVRPQVVIIANNQVAEDSIDQTRLLDFYTGDIRRWDGGEQVVVFDLKEKGETRDTFFEYVGKSSSRMRSIWLKRMLAGEGDPPEALETEDDMVKRVAETPGAIGFVRKKFVSDSVKILAIIPAKE